MATYLSPSSKLNNSQKTRSISKVLYNSLSSKAKVKIDKSRYTPNRENINDFFPKAHMPLNSSIANIPKLQLAFSEIKPYSEQGLLTGKSSGYKLPMPLPLSFSSKNDESSHKLNRSKQNKSKSSIAMSISPCKPLNSSRNNKNQSNNDILISTHHNNHPHHRKTISMTISNPNTSNINKQTNYTRPNTHKTNGNDNSVSKSPINKMKHINKSNAIKVNKAYLNNQRVKKGVKQISITRNTNNNTLNNSSTVLMHISNIRSNIFQSLGSNNNNSSSSSNTLLQIQKAPMVNAKLENPELKNSIHISSSANNFNTFISHKHSNSMNKVKLNARKKVTKHISSMNTFTTSTNLSSNDIISNNQKQKAKKSSRNSQASYKSSNSLTNMDTFNKSMTINNGKSIYSISKISQTGFAGSNKYKVNQDNLFVYSTSTSASPCISNDNEYHFIGVCDGHGNKGELISKFIIETLPIVLNKEMKESNISLSSSTNAQIHKAIDNSFILTNSKLSNESTIDTHFSGSTCVSVLFSNEKIFCANVGDSRALLGRYTRTTNQWDYISLSRDHKPTELDEAKRIIRYGGRIDQFKDDDGTKIGPLRIWLKSESIPGLAMTRSIGDRIASNVGVICEPEIKDVILKEEDKFVILASDGLWEYISNEECIEIVGHYYMNSKDAENAIKELYKKAFRQWIENEATIDDITIILIFFD